ncbi:MAG: ABC transporter permease [Erysipelotrichaceae bacterium]|nr:ABC transporter permease [Erysipelotrichaceae bacterium]
MKKIHFNITMYYNVIDVKIHSNVKSKILLQLFIIEYILWLVAANYGSFNKMLIIELIILCLLFFLICYKSTGSDDKNIKSYASYPDKVQKKIKEDSCLQSQIKETSPIISFISNILVFGVILFVFEFFIKSSSFKDNFMHLMILGEGVNAFDFVVIDLLWWRNTPRIRFKNIQDKALYQDSKKHFISFMKGIVLFIIIALLDAILLSLL